MPSEAINRGLRSVRGAKRSHAAKKDGLSGDQRAEIDAALGAYGARLTDDDRIAKGDKVMSVQVEAKGGRLKMVGGGNVLATYPASRAGQGVSDFVEKFWFWRKDATASAHATKKKQPAQLQREIDEVLAGTSGRSKRSKQQRLHHATVADEWDVVMDAVLEGDVKRAAEIVENIRREHGVTAAETLMVANVPKAVPVKVWNAFLKAIGREREARHKVGDRVQLPVWTDAWMRGDRYGVITKFTAQRSIAHVLLDKSGKMFSTRAKDLSKVD